MMRLLFHLPFLALLCAACCTGGRPAYGQDGSDLAQAFPAPPAPAPSADGQWKPRADPSSASEPSSNAGSSYYYDPPSVYSGVPSAAPPSPLPATRPIEYGPPPAATSTFAYPPADDAPDMPPPVMSIPLIGTFGKGFELHSKDNEFSFQFHNLTQFDARFYSHDMDPTQDTFAMPREWLVFSGNVTKQIEYMAAFAFGFDNVNLLDGYINFRPDDRFQVKVGRYKTPFTYEFYTLPIQGLIQPERSLFFNNFGINRDLGVMIHGSIFDKAVDYAFGVFNGHRNGYLDTNDAKDVMGYLNVRPFQGSDSALEHLHVGGSFDYGEQDNAPLPDTLRTNVATTGNPIMGVPFLDFNAGVREDGPRALGSLHLAWYWQQLSLVSEYQGGRQEYSRLGNRTSLSVRSWYVQAGYFLTGEVVTSRNVVEPLNDFNPSQGGWGAWELTARYNRLNIDDDVFDAGLADPTLWTDELWLLDLGVNWYLNRFLKVSAVWEHASFSNPVQYRPGSFSDENDMLFTRLQLYF